MVLIAANYHGAQQAQALGILAGTPAISGALAFFVAGLLGTWLSWRYSFGLLSFVSIIVFLLSFRLKPVPRQSGVKIDAVGVALSAIAGYRPAGKGRLRLQLATVPGHDVEVSQERAAAFKAWLLQAPA